MTTAPTDSAITETADAVGIRSSALFAYLPPDAKVYHGERPCLPAGVMLAVANAIWRRRK